jgi:hypothetical protein
MAKTDCEGWYAPGLERNASIVWIGSMLRDGSRESKRNSCISPYGDDFQERIAAHWANLNSLKWMLWNDGVDMAEFRMTRVRIGSSSTPWHTQKQTVNGLKVSKRS